jgi:hypothetical protein
MRKSIQTRLVNRFGTLERAEQVFLYNLFAKVRDSGASAGISFEAIGQRIQDGMTLWPVPMVHLPNGSLHWQQNVSLDSAAAHDQHTTIRMVEYDINGPETIPPNVFYVPEATSENPLDSFILIINNFSFVLRFTSSLKYGIKSGLFDS